MVGDGVICQHEEMDEFLDFFSNVRALECKVSLLILFSSVGRLSLATARTRRDMKLMADQYVVGPNKTHTSAAFLRLRHLTVHKCLVSEALISLKAAGGERSADGRTTILGCGSLHPAPVQQLKSQSWPSLPSS